MLTERHFPEVNFSKLFLNSGSLDAFNVESLQPGQEIQNEWTFEEVRIAYRNMIVRVREKTGADLTWNSRNIHFVKREQLTMGEAGAYYESKYGPHMLREIAGNCVPLPDGTFDMNAVYKGEGKITNPREVIQVLGHEHGHTLGGFIPDITLEEMKATAFEALSMEHLLGNSYKFTEGIFADKPHDVARNMVKQLTDRGFPHESIIATLTGEPFGKFKPDSNMQIPVTRSL